MEVNNSTKNSSIDVNASVVCSVSLEISAKSADDIKPQCDDSGYHSWSNLDCSPDFYECNDRVSRSAAAVKQVTMQSDCYGDNETSSLKNHQINDSGLHRCHDSNGLTSRGTACTASPAHVMNDVSVHSTCLYQGNVDGNRNHISQSSSPRKHYDAQFIKSHSACVSCSASVGICATASVHYDSSHNLNNLSYEETLIARDASHSLYESAKCRTVQHDGATKDNFNSEAHELAIKIDFCLMFGYTADQIRVAITKLNYRASKNDILAELSSIQCAPIAIRRPTGDALEQEAEASLSGAQYETAGEAVGSLVSHGTGASVKSSDQPRGPSTQPQGHSTVDGENKGLCNKTKEDDFQNLRPVVIDGSNVAMSHGNKQFFSCKGILLAVDFFRSRNHRDITVFVPTYRKESPRPDAPIRDREILNRLEKERILVYTPSRCINGRRVTCYDDRFILKLAQETGGVIVSNDNFRDLQNERPEWKELIEKRLLMYSFVSDRFMPPDDPLGRNGPSIDNFLRRRPASEEQIKPQCPYGKKCTYGKKCKYFHPECAISVTDTLKERADKRVKASNEATKLATSLIAEQRDNQSKNNLKSYSSGNNPYSGSDIAIPGRKHAPSGEGSHVPSQTKMSSDSSPASYPHHPQYKNKRDVVKSIGRLNISDDRNPVPVGHCRNSTCGCYECNYHPYPTPRPPPYNPLHHHHHYPDMIPPAEGQKKAMSGHFQSPMPAIPPPMTYHQQQQQPMPPSYLPSHHMYPHMDPQYLHNQPQQVMYPYSIPNSPSQPMHHNMLPNTGPYYVPPQYHNHTSGSDNSLSHSYPFVASPDHSLYAPVAHHNMSSPNCNSDPKTFPPRNTRRVYSSPGHHHPQMRVHPAPSYPNGDVSHPPTSYPLSHSENSRHHLFQNLCGLFKRDIVEKVMTSHPNITKPKAIIAICLNMSE